MEILKAFIIDDEIQSRNFLYNTLQKHFPEMMIAGQAGNIEQGLTGIREHRPGIVFLDIQLNGETGFDLLNQLTEIDFSLIFTTAFSQYAIKAFRFNAVDYLLKPIIADELVEAVNKVKQRAGLAPPSSRPQLDQLYYDIKNPRKIHDKIGIPTDEGFLFIPVNDIIYCHADSNYTRFYLSDKKCIISSYTLKHYAEILTQQSFFRAHRSYLVNLAHIKMYRRREGGEIVMSNGHEVELSRTHKDELLHLLDIKK